MPNVSMKIWEDDLPEELMERLAGVLCELGVLVRKSSSGMDGDFVVSEYDFELAEPLEEPAFI